MRVSQFRRPVALFSLKVLLASVAVVASSQSFATTYYVRTDGGDASQCNGRANAAYSGSGTGKACAWKGPHYALPADGKPRIAGGDTLYIGPGDYMIGFGAPGANGGRCYSGGPYDCYMAPVPSGPDASHKTRIIGRQAATGCTLSAPVATARGLRSLPVLQAGCVANTPTEVAGVPTAIPHLDRAAITKCSAPPKLWGNQRVTKIINLEGSSNVEIGCLEITDKSDCVEFHSDAKVRCARDNPPYGEWASIGISAAKSSKVWLHDLNIHGLAHTGIQAGGLTDWTVDRVKIVANGWVGWDGDIGAASANAGRILMRNITVAWNGCGQRWKTGEIHACWGQQEGGYGDGIGTASTGGAWIIEDSYVHHNVSDGIDLLYLDGSAGASATIRRSLVVANAGNQIKTRGTALIENSVVVGQCAYFNGRYNMSSGDQCRALGNTLSLALSNGRTATVRNNTIIGEGDCLILGSGGNDTARLNVQNNALVGQPDWRNGTQGYPELTCGYYGDQSTAVISYAGNAFWNVKGDQCPGGNNVCGKNPKLANMTMAAFDPTPLPGSPLIDKGMVINGLTQDYNLQRRASGSAPDIGAIETSTITVRTSQRWRGAASSTAALVKTQAGGTFRVDDVNGSASGLAVGAGYTVAASGDFNGDGLSDVAWSNGRQLKFAINDGVGGLATAAATRYDSRWSVVGAADIDGDGKAELLWRNGSALGYWKIDGSAVSSGSVGVLTPGYRLVGHADLDADGADDLVWSNGSRVAVWLNNGDGRFSVAWEGATPAGWQAVTVEDVDSDGAADIVWDVNGRVAYWTLDGATPKATHYLETASAGNTTSTSSVPGRARLR